MESDFRDGEIRDEEIKEDGPEGDQYQSATHR
jgi:hypothetical protein